MPPNPALLERYGTDRYYLEKMGSIGIDAITAATGAAFMGLAAHDAAHVRQQREEAAAMNEMFRAREAYRMSPVIAGFKGASAPISEERFKLADALGRSLARSAVLGVDGLPKVAMALPFTGTARMLGAMKPAAGAATGGVGLIGRARGMLQGGTGRLNAAAKAEGLGDVVGQMKDLKGAMKGVPSPVGGRGNAAINLASATPAPGATQALTGVGKGFTAVPAEASTAFHSGVTKGLKGGGADLAATAAPASAAAATGAPAAAAGSKPLIGWKGKALAAGAIGGIGYAGYKGLGATRDYMMQPTQSQTWGQHGPRPKAGINEWGVPQ